MLHKLNGFLYRFITMLLNNLHKRIFYINTHRFFAPQTYNDAPF